MPTPFDMQRQQMGQRMMGATPPGAPGVSTGMPPPQGNPGQAPGGGSSRLEPLLQQVMQILVEGNPADLEAFGKFMGELNQLVQDHQGQGMPQGGAPMGGAPQSGMPPQM